MVKDDFEFNYKKEKKKKIVLSDIHIEIIIKVVFFTLLVMGLVGIGLPPTKRGNPPLRNKYSKNS